MDEKRIRHLNVTFTVVMVAVALFFAIAMDTCNDVTWHHYACLALVFAIPCFVIWRI